MNTETAIDTFLATWKEKSTAYYIETAERKIHLGAICEALMKKYKLQTFMKDQVLPADYVEAKKNYSIFIQSLTQQTADIIYKHSNPRHPFNLSDFLDKEVEKKKNNLIARAEKKGGKIVDASCLFISGDGNINGYVQCEDRQVKVRTIMASGEVQCLHYRVLVK
jgi:hypothetical protein